jgi:hypothetical protein
VRFLRHLATVLVVVTAIVLLAMAWNHAAGGGLASGPLHGHDLRVAAGRLAQGPHGEVVVRVRGAHGLEVINARPMDLGLTSMFDSVNLPSLRHTVVIEAAAATAVVIIDLIRRRWRRRARRAGS